MGEVCQQCRQLEIYHSNPRLAEQFAPPGVEIQPRGLGKPVFACPVGEKFLYPEPVVD